MSKNRTQITYKCECLIDPWGGTCEKTSRFMLVSNCSIDTNTIYHQYHDGEWKLYEPGEYISDPEINALSKVLSVDPHGKDAEPIHESYAQSKNTK